MNNFHISLPCKDLVETEKFYTEFLNCDIGRRSRNWFDIDFFGNQITFIDSVGMHLKSRFYSFDGVILPSFHFGILLGVSEWCNLWEVVKGKPCVKIKPTVFLKNKVGEHESFLISDPSDYSIEFKTFKEEFQIFAS